MELSVGVAIDEAFNSTRPRGSEEKSKLDVGFRPTSNDANLTGSPETKVCAPTVSDELCNDNERKLVSRSKALADTAKPLAGRGSLCRTYSASSDEFKGSRLSSSSAARRLRSRINRSTAKARKARGSIAPPIRFAAKSSVPTPDTILHEAKVSGATLRNALLERSSSRNSASPLKELFAIRRMRFHVKRSVHNVGVVMKASRSRWSSGTSP